NTVFTFLSPDVKPPSVTFPAFKGANNLSVFVQILKEESGLRAFAAVVLGLSLTALTLMLNDANNAGTEESSALTSPKEPATAASAVDTEIQHFRALVEEQRQELADERAELKALPEKLATPAAVAPAVSSSTVPAPATVTAVAPPAIGAPSSKPAKPADE